MSTPQHRQHDRRGHGARAATEPTARWRRTIGRVATTFTVVALVAGWAMVSQPTRSATADDHDDPTPPELTGPGSVTLETGAGPVALDQVAAPITLSGDPDDTWVVAHLTLTGAEDVSFTLPDRQGASLAIGYDTAVRVRDVVLEGSRTSVAAALALLELDGGETAGSASLEVEVFDWDSEYPYNGRTRTHYWWELIDPSPAKFQGPPSQLAQTAASRTYRGRPGYLVTITSREELDFLRVRLATLTDFWIGAQDPTGEGRWSWRTGPESGLEFWADGAPVGDAFAFWCEDQPTPDINSWAIATGRFFLCWSSFRGFPQAWVVEFGDGEPFDGSLRHTVAITVEDPAPTSTSQPSTTSTSQPSTTQATTTSQPTTTSTSQPTTTSQPPPTSTSQPTTTSQPPPPTTARPAPMVPPAPEIERIPVDVPNRPSSGPVVVAAPGSGVLLRFGDVRSTAADPNVRITTVTPNGSERERRSRGTSAVGEVYDIEVSGLEFGEVEVCVPFRSGDHDALPRLRLVHTTDARERDITTTLRTADDGRRLVCGVTDHFSDVQVVALRTDRIGGADRFATAAAVSRAQFPDGAPGVVIASSSADADAVVAGALAARLGAPLLLVAGTGVPDATSTELARLRPDRVVIVGGERAVPPAVARQLDARVPGADVQRVAGADRYESAVLVALGVDGAVPRSSGSTVLIGSGHSSADKLVAGVEAARTGSALLLVRPDQLDAVVRDALVTLDPARVVVVGGPAAVPDAVVAQISASVPSAAVERIGGADRYETAAAMAERSGGPVAPVASVFVATGVVTADASAVMSLAAAGRAPLVLVAGDRVPDATSRFLDRLAPERLTVVGGERAVVADAELRLARAMAPAPVGAL